MDNFKSSKQDRQTRKDLMIEHVLIELTKTFLLICISIFLFFHGTLLYGFLVGIFAYFYVFYGLFVKAPVEVKPYPYIGGSAFYKQEQRRFENDRRIKIEKIKGARQRSHSPRTNVKSSAIEYYGYARNQVGLGLDNDDDWGVNPATGLPMTGCIDVAGNPYGSDMSHDVDIFSNDDLNSSVIDDFEISSTSDDDWNS
ncbi:hypothetical protein [Flavobacterium sp. W21_SRS_FM6]|uniref:hypothetical protein n=1 Tax=Flavobacterium sp. W21_SRS_FM6 TaxID=3240268 RepID=UPI003F926107